MAKFIYKMENILSLKYKMEDQAKVAYGVAQKKLTLEEEKLFTLKKRMAMYLEKTRIMMQTRLDVTELRSLSQAVELMKTQIKVQELVVKRAESHLELMRSRLNGAMLERKTHEKLKENAFSAFVMEIESEERKEMDELVSFKYNNPADN
ncbi:MAG: flagellar export protein FliJ [Anaerocolumna sp.]